MKELKNLPGYYTQNSALRNSKGGYSVSIYKGNDLIATVIDYTKYFGEHLKHSREFVAVYQVGEYRLLDISNKAIANAKTLKTVINRAVAIHEGGKINPLKWCWA